MVPFFDASRRAPRSLSLLSALDLTPWLAELDWVIAGGESGGHAGPSDREWFRALRDQCVAASFCGGGGRPLPQLPLDLTACLRCGFEVSLYRAQIGLGLLQQ